MNVKLMRMWSGEDVVADLIEEKDDSVVICNPIVAVLGHEDLVLVNYQARWH